MAEDDKKSEMIEIGGLWKNKSKDGDKTYLAGYLGNAKLLVFPNQFKEKDGNEKAPDFRIYVAKMEKKSKDGDGGSKRSSDPF